MIFPIRAGLVTACFVVVVVAVGVAVMMGAALPEAACAPLDLGFEVAGTRDCDDSATRDC